MKRSKHMEKPTETESPIGMLHSKISGASPLKLARLGNPHVRRNQNSNRRPNPASANWGQSSPRKNDRCGENLRSRATTPPVRLGTVERKPEVCDQLICRSVAVLVFDRSLQDSLRARIAELRLWSFN
jgi:hypothetical protein